MANISPIMSILQSIMNSNPFQPFPFEKYYDELNRKLSTQDERQMFEEILNFVQQSGSRIVTKDGSYQFNKLIVNLEQYLYSIQRLDAVCDRLRRRVDWTLYNNKSKRYPENIFDIIGYKAIYEMFRLNSEFIITTFKLELSKQLSEQTDCKSQSISQFAQYIFWFDEHLKVQTQQQSFQSNFFQKFVYEPFLTLMNEYFNQLSSKLLSGLSSNNGNPDWNKYLETINDQWLARLRGQLSVIFVRIQTFSNQLHCIPLINYTDQQNEIYFKLCNNLLNEAKKIYFEQTIIKQAQLILNFIENNFIELIFVKPTTKSKPNRTIVNCFQLIKSFYNGLPLNERKIYFEKMFQNISNRFETIKKTNQNLPIGNKTITLEQHLYSVECLYTLEQSYTRLVQYFLYNNKEMKLIIQRQMTKIVNTQTNHSSSCSSFAKCLAWYMHRQLNSGYNADQHDYSKLGNLNIMP